MSLKEQKTNEDAMNTLVLDGALGPRGQASGAFGESSGQEHFMSSIGEMLENLIELISHVLGGGGISENAFPSPDRVSKRSSRQGRSASSSSSSSNLITDPTVVGIANNLVDYISRVEVFGKQSSNPDLKTADAYDGVYHGARPHFEKYSAKHFDGRSPTELKVGEVNQWRSALLSETNVRSSAFGGIQIVGDTFREEVRKLGLGNDAVMDIPLQQKIGHSLLNRAGFEDFLSGDMTLDDFQDRLAGTWASLKGSNGVGRYDGDVNGNMAYGSAKDLRNLLVQSKNAYQANLATNVASVEGRQYLAEAGVTKSDMELAQNNIQQQPVMGFGAPVLQPL